jgi:hypothetical protein
MLHVGIELYAYGFTITVLSDGFAQLGQRKFRFSDCKGWIHWVNQFKNTGNEAACYYFDTYDFSNPDYPGHLFESFIHDDFVYLVNHRLVCNLRQFLVEFFAQFNIRNDVLAMSFILASAPRLFSEDDLRAPAMEYL